MESYFAIRKDKIYTMKSNFAIRKDKIFDIVTTWTDMDEVMLKKII